MDLVRDVMSHSAVYVTCEATVRTAVELLLAHQTHVVPVVQDGEVVGLLDPLTLSLYDGEVFVKEVIRETPLTVEAETPISEAAMRMRAGGLRQVPVLQEGKLVGLLSDRDLLTTWGSANDPLTGLPIQHRLRRWASLNLSAGREIIILFLDLNGFGALNKQYGHVVGDQILQHVAQTIRETADSDEDFPCRYGGDEFAVGTLRRPAEARELAARIRDRVTRTRSPEFPPVDLSIGLAGGQRLRPRQGTHVSATLDDLITQASTASTAAKHAPDHICAHQRASNGKAAVEALLPGGGALPRVVVEGYRLGQAGAEAEVTVTLRLGQQTREGRSRAPEGDLMRALARTTAQCLQGFAPDLAEIRVEDTYEYTTPQGIICVGATVTLVRGTGGTERLVGTSPMRDDAYRTYINAVLDATNRRLAQNGVAH